MFKMLTCVAWILIATVSLLVQASDPDVGKNFTPPTAETQLSLESTTCIFQSQPTCYKGEVDEGAVYEGPDAMQLESLSVQPLLSIETSQTNVVPNITIAGLSGSWQSSELVTSKGFVPEEHHVVTEDKYILGVFRVNCRRNCCREKVIYISTPLFMDSDAFVADFPNNSLAFLLADNGFDVWIGNIRGTKYSRAKIGNFHPSSRDFSFFDYTFIDAGLKDIPAGIDYVLQKTNRERLFYLGHSQATAGLFALLSVRPEYNHKIIAMTAMCPFRRISCDVGQKEQYGTLADIAHNYKSLNALRLLIGEFPPSTVPIDVLCRISQTLCSYLMHTNLGPSPNLNQSRFDVYMKFIPASTSLKNLVLFAQMSTRSCRNITDVYDMDYDDLDSSWSVFSTVLSRRETNMQKYGQRYPTYFNVTDIKIPVKLYYASDDGYSTASEAEILAKELPNFRGSFDLGKGYGHYDLIMPTYNSSHVYDAINFLNSFVFNRCKI